MPGVVTTKSSAFVARFSVKPAQREEFLALFDGLWRGALDFMNAQCNFVFYGWDRTDRWFYTIESYKDEAILEGLRQSEMFQQTVARLLEMCESNMEFTLLRGMDCDSAVFDRYPAGESQVHPRSGEIGVWIA